MSRQQLSTHVTSRWGGLGQCVPHEGFWADLAASGFGPVVCDLSATVAFCDGTFTTAVSWCCLACLALQVDGILEDSDLYAKHKAAATAALTAFNHAAMGEPELVKEFEERLNKGRAAADICTLCMPSTMNMCIEHRCLPKVLPCAVHDVLYCCIQCEAQ